MVSLKRKTRGAAISSAPYKIAHEGTLPISEQSDRINIFRTNELIKKCVGEKTIIL